MTPAEILARAMSTMPDEAWDTASAQARRYWMDQAQAVLDRIAPMIAAELVEALRKASDYLHGSNPLNVAGGHRNHDLREKLGATLAKWEGKA